jgi:WD40 repeat protein
MTAANQRNTHEIADAPCQNSLLVLLPVVLFQLLWRVAYYRPFHIDSKPGYSDVVAFSPDGDTMAICGLNGPVQLWSYKTRRLLATLPPSVSGRQTLQFMKDRPLLVVSRITA